MNHRIDFLTPEEIVRVEIEDACYQILESLARFADQIRVTVRRSES
jgi:hypothetical protein